MALATSRSFLYGKRVRTKFKECNILTKMSDKVTLVIFIVLSNGMKIYKNFCYVVAKDTVSMYE
jgi:hypothetical protein